MTKPISKELHGAIDYSYSAIVPLLPEIVGLKGSPTASLLCRTLGGGALAYTVLTKAKWGLFKVLPFNAHLAIDLTVSAFALASPWLLAFAANKQARNTLVGVGLAGLTASILTQPDQGNGDEQSKMFV